MQFYPPGEDNVVENETELWSSSSSIGGSAYSRRTMAFNTISSSSSPSPLQLEDIELLHAASLILPTSKAHYHHHRRHHHYPHHYSQNIHYDSEEILDGSSSSAGGIKATATSKILNSAATMVQGVIESVTVPPSSASYHSQYYGADLDPSILSSTGGSAPPAYFSTSNDSSLGDIFLNSSELATNDSMNSSLIFMEMPVRDPLYITIPITVIYVIILLIGLLGNVVTCIVIVRSRYLHTTTNYYLFSLAISDLLLLLSGLPVEMYSMWWKYPYVFGEYFCIGRGLAAETSANATVLTITAFTIERYLAICRPFMIQKWQNKLSRVVRQILIIWVISISLAVPQALQFGIVEGPVGQNRNSTFCMIAKQPLIQHSFEIATFVFFVAPLILITVLYTLIGLTLRNASNVKESKLRLRKSLSNHKREVGQQRVLKMLVAVVVAFVLTWFPHHLQRLMALFLENNHTLQMVYIYLTYVSGVMYYLSTCINPLIYHIFSLKFRHAFQENVKSCCGERLRKRKPFRERELLVGPPSMSHSSHSRSQGIVLTDITPITLCSNHTHISCHHQNQANGNLHPPHAAHTKVKLEVKFQGSEV